MKKLVWISIFLLYKYTIPKEQITDKSLSAFDFNCCSLVEIHKIENSSTCIKKEETLEKPNLVIV